MADAPGDFIERLEIEGGIMPASSGAGGITGCSRKKNVLTELINYTNNEFKNISREKIFNRNHSLALSNPGSFGELIALHMYPKSIGSGSKGGCAFDNVELNPTTKKIDTAREVKSVVLEGTKKCKNKKCGKKAPRFQTKCLFCDNTEFTLKHDSRAGICAKAHIEYKEILKEYIIFVIKYNESKNAINIRCFKILSSNLYFNEYVENQYNNGGNTCNLLPYSWDWQLSGPIKLFDIDFYEDKEHNINMYDLENKNHEKLQLINSNTDRKVFTKSCLENYSDEITEEMFGTDGLSYDEYAGKFKHTQKSFGKPRGETSRIR